MTEKESFLTNELVRSAVRQKLTVIGEAVSRLPEELRQRHTDIPWRGIAAFRNIAVHAYFSVDWELVWTAATHDTPILREQIARVLAGLPEDDIPLSTS